MTLLKFEQRKPQPIPFLPYWQCEKFSAKNSPGSSSSEFRPSAIFHFPTRYTIPQFCNAPGLGKSSKLSNFSARGNLIEFRPKILLKTFKETSWSKELFTGEL